MDSAAPISARQAPMESVEVQDTGTVASQPERGRNA
jgi:hypothetical protein